MKIGHLNYKEYIDSLYEAVNVDKLEDNAGIVIPEENKKAFDWLKKEYDKGKIEAECEFKIGSNDFSPGFELQTKLDSVKEFKPGLFGAKIKPDITDGTKSDFKPTVYKDTKSEYKSLFDDNVNKSDNKENTESEDNTDIESSDKSDVNKQPDEKSEPYKKEFKFDLSKRINKK
ncbi:MAG: hypothetical protein RSE41_02605 [Clostridia bacterium]